MPNPVAFLHPQKLYSMLRACASAESRARAALEFVRGNTGSELGFLFLSRGEGLTLAAATRESRPPAGMDRTAFETFQRRLTLPPDDTRTLDVSEIRASAKDEHWTSETGETYEHRMLATYRDGEFRGIGIAMLKRNADHELAPVRHMHVEALCAALIDSGDVA